MSRKTWTEEEITTLKLMAGKKPIMDIAKALNRTEASVYLFCYRNKIPLRETLELNTVQKMFDIRFGDWRLFHPNKAFYSKTGISQKRFQDIFGGFAAASADEIKSIARAINLSDDETFELMGVIQLSLFPDLTD